MTIHGCLGLLSRFAEALRDEAQAQRREGGRPIPVTDGRRLHGDAAGSVYRFDLHADVFLPDGIPVVLVVRGSPYAAEVLHREGDWIYLFVAAEASQVPSEIARAELRAEPWFLHEELAARLDEVTAQVQQGERDLGVAELLLEEIQVAADSRTRRGLANDRAPFTIETPESSSSGLVRSSVSDQALNPYQVAAVQKCLGEPLWFVWGPPGTGKTATLGRLVARLAEEPGSVLVTAHANVAVDAAVLAIWRMGNSELRDQLLRVGPAALAEVRDLRVSSRDRALQRRPDLARRLGEIQEQLARLEKGKEKATGGLSRDLVQELREIRTKIQEEERSVIREGRLVAATLSKIAIAPQLYERTFQTTVVDEASMAYAAQVAMAGTLARDRLSVFGDFRQLPPIVISNDRETQGLLRRDVFELTGIVNAVNTATAVADISMLRLQYRMHPELRKLVSDFAYASLLQDAPGIAECTETLVMQRPLPGHAVVRVDTSRFGARNWRDHSRRSRWDPLSAVWAFKIAAELAQSGCSVAILTPYRAQVYLLGAMVRGFRYRDLVAVGTVHRFQGAERDVVVLDLVASPPLPVPGLLLEGSVGKRLLTVAASRAKGKLVVLVSPELLARSHLVSQLFAGVASIRLELTDWELQRGDATLTWWSANGLKQAKRRLERDIANGEACIWHGSDLPLAGVKTRGRAPDGQALVVVQSVVWLFAQPISEDLVGARISDPGTAGACRNILGHSATLPLSAVDAATGLPRCRCGSAMTLELGGGRDRRPFAVCHACSWKRDAKTEDLTIWASVMKLQCPHCGGELQGRSGPWGLFLGCKKYPRCKGRRRPEDVL